VWLADKPGIDLLGLTLSYKPENGMQGFVALVLNIK
jgi:hypothetical protein